MMKKQRYGYLTIVFGLFLLGGGLFMLKLLTNPQGVLLALPYICIGVGCGLFGHGMGDVVNQKVFTKHPELQLQMEIDKNDERNVAIANRSKAKAYDLMIFVFGALMVSFALMGVQLAALLLLVSAYLFVIGFSVYYRFKYEKEM